MPTRFTRTETVLDKILDHKVEEIAARRSQVTLNRLIQAAAQVAPPRELCRALRRPTVTLIAEVKRASPSKGILIQDFDPPALATLYEKHGAAALSVLTDSAFFMGSLDHLRDVRAAVDLPVLRKDFVIDPYQVYEARAAGADSVLLIAAALDDAQLTDLHALVLDLNMAALVEVHDAGELERALRINPALVGINNRDLRTFQVDLGVSLRLAPMVPQGVTLVAESGIFTGEHVRQLGAAGAHAVLVGEALVKARDMAAQVQKLSRQPREAQG